MSRGGGVADDGFGGSASAGAGVFGVGLEEFPEGGGDLAFEAAERFFGGFAFGEFALVVVAGGWMPADLGDRDAVQDGVELAVAAAVQAVADVLAGAGGDGGGAGDARVFGGGGEALRAGGLADCFGGAQHAAAGEPQERRPIRGHED